MSLPCFIASVCAFAAVALLSLPAGSIARAPHGPPSAKHRPEPSPSASSVLDRVGARLRRATGAATRRDHRVAIGLDLIDDRRLTLIVVGASSSALVRWWLAPLVIAGSVLLAWRSAVRERSLHQQQRNDAAPFLIDVVRAGLAAGAEPRATLLALGVSDVPRTIRALQPTLAELARRVPTGEPFHDALAHLARASPDLRAMVAALQSSERLGVGIGATLDVLAIDARLTRRRRAETRARRLPVVLLFPLVTCILPAFGVLTVVPLLVSGLSAVRW